MAGLTARVEEPVGVARAGEPLTHGVPFPPGALWQPERVGLHAAGGPLPTQGTALARWPDGSVKWLLVDSLLDLAARQVLPVRLEHGPGGHGAPVPEVLTVTPVPDGLRIETGGVGVVLAASGTRLIGAAGDCLAASSDPQMTLRDADGCTYLGVVEGIEVETRNALRVVVRATGGFVDADGRRPLSWLARLYFWAHCPYLRLYHTIVHDADDPVLFRLQELRLAFALALSPQPQVLIGAPQGLTADRGLDLGRRSERVELWEMHPGRCSILGLKEGRLERTSGSHGWICAADDQRAVQLKLRHPSQNHPKMYAFDPRTGQLELSLYPDPDRWVAPAAAGRNYLELNLRRSGDYGGPLQVPQGMAKTHEIYLGFGGPAPDLVEAAARAARWQHPLLLEVDARAVAESGVLGDFPPYYPRYWRLEEKLRAGVWAVDRGALTGMMSFGDTGVAAGDGDCQSTLTTDNVAYDVIRSVLGQYMRRGEQPLFWRGEAMAFHLMDVDTIHHSSAHPEWIGGPHDQWAQFHAYNDTGRDTLRPPSFGHTWVGGLLDYYYLSGYRRAWDVARSTGRYCCGTYTRKWGITPGLRDRWDDPRQEWDYWTRDAGWALTGMADLYEATHDPALAEGMRELVGVLARWQDDEGRWRHPIGSFNRGGVPFMTASILTGLMRTWEGLGDPLARQLCLRGCRFLTRMTTPEGLLYYKEAPVSSTAPAAAAVLNMRPLAFAYAQTGERELLRCMWRFCRWRLDEGGSLAAYEVKDLLWALPTLERAGLLAAWQGVDTE